MLDMLPPLNALRSFALVAMHGSLAAAASMQNITQPAVGKRIRQLEAHLGVQLLVRGANTVALTAQGRQYAIEISRVFRDIEDATGRLKKDIGGPLRIRCYTTWATRWLIPRLPRFKRDNPGCEIEIVTAVEPVDFRRDHVAAAVVSAGEEPPTENAGRLQTIRIAPFASPEVAAAGHSVVNATTLGSLNRPDDWSIWSKAAGTVLKGPMLTFETTALAIEMALSGMGVVIASGFMVSDELARGRLVQLGQLVDSGSRYWLALPPKSRRKDAFALRDWLAREAAAEEAAYRIRCQKASGIERESRRT